jgi:hypothetical protein
MTLTTNDTLGAFDPKSLEAVFVRDRTRAARHEAAHLVVAHHFGVAGIAITQRMVDLCDAPNWSFEDKTHLGQTIFVSKPLRRSIEECSRIICVAGAVGECLGDEDFPQCKYERANFAHENMSVSDCRGANIPTANESLDYAYEDDDFANAVDEAFTLLTGELAGQWRWAANRLIVPRNRKFSQLTCGHLVERFGLPDGQSVVR